MRPRVEWVTDPTSASPLLQTKLYVPRSRPGLVSRARLIERLNQAIEGKLTVVCAPAGSAKTTLLGQWLATQPAAAWLSLDQSDTDPTRFWAYVIAALRTVHAEIGRATLSLLRSAQSLPVETLLGPLLNEIAALTQHSVLVIDDYHLIDTQPIHRGIGFLLDHSPARLHLVIASRGDPPLPLSRLRARAELAELRASDLRFTLDGSVTFLNEVTGLDLTGQEVVVLEARTEGWIAGLQLVALSMPGRHNVAGFMSAFTRNDRYIVDYLIEEVLQALDARLALMLSDLSDQRAAVVQRLNRAGVPVIGIPLLPIEDGYYFTADNIQQALRRYDEWRAWTQQHGLVWAGLAWILSPTHRCICS